MKVIINLETLEVREVLDFCDVNRNLAGKKPVVTNNGQHMQMLGHVLAEINILEDSADFTLLHPDTTEGSGHIDVLIRYKDGNTPTFHRYSGYEEFIPNKTSDDLLNLVWPTGAWSLLQIVLSIESFLEKKNNFVPALRYSIMTNINLSNAWLLT